MERITPVRLAQQTKYSRISLPPEVRHEVDALFQSLSITPGKLDNPESLAIPPGKLRYPSLNADLPDAASVLHDAELNEFHSLSVAEAVLQEARLAVGSSRFVAALQGEESYLELLHRSREQAAIAIYDFARGVNWRRPVLFLRALKIARGYLRHVVSNSGMTPEENRSQFTSRLGVATVLCSRFERVDKGELEESCQALAVSISQGNDIQFAVPYYLEAETRVFDVTGDAKRLLLGVRRAKNWFEEAGKTPFAQGYLAFAEAYLRLSASGAGTNALVGALDESLRAMRNVELDRLEFDDELKALMLDRILKRVQADSSLLEADSFRGLSLPFGRAGQAEPKIIGIVRDDLIDALMAPSRRGDLMARGISADLLTRSFSKNSADALRTIVEMRGGVPTDTRHHDPKTVLLTARDGLHLAQLEPHRHERSRYINSLVDLVRRGVEVPTALIVIAQDVEKNGPVHGLGRFEGTSGLYDLLVRGDYMTVFRQAAELAFKSPDLMEARLGGRSEVRTVGDYYGLIHQEFVDKEMAAVAVRRERARVEVLAAAFREDKEADRYAFADHLFELPGDEVGRVNSIRRYIPGVSALRKALDGPPEETEQVLIDVAQFLGRMNRIEATDGSGARRDLKAKEVGRWLKGLDPASASSLFEQWWACVGGVCVFARRDAHLENWVYSDSGQVVALDLEAVGARPAGYELAQVTDDAPVLKSDDWPTRRRVLRAYVDALQDGRDVQETVSRLFPAYQAAVAARLLRRITAENADTRDLKNARQSLEWLSEHADKSALKQWSVSVLASWDVARGVMNPKIHEVTIGMRRRTKISKSMAYFLRHEGMGGSQENGWVPVIDLVRAIGEQYQVSANEVRIVASDLSEPRFELSPDDQVRARYGHSRDSGTRVELKTFEPRIPLYHSTTSRAARAVIEEGGGLQPMSRRYVHLATTRVEALRAGGRHGFPFLLATAGGPDGSFWKGNARVILADSVPSKRVRVEPLAAYWELLPNAKFED